MTQEEKELLLKDLCARLPYSVKVHAKYTDLGETIEVDGIVKMIDADGIVKMIDADGVVGIEVMYDASSSFIGVDIDDVKPYLFPLSSMTEEQQEELITITNGKFRYMLGDITNAIPRKNTSEWGIDENAFINSIKVINILYKWLLKNHFDINGLIPIGCAIDATGKNIY